MNNAPQTNDACDAYYSQLLETIKDINLTNQDILKLELRMLAIGFLLNVSFCLMILIEVLGNC